MQTELQAELILCPNCKEEVPKTLYCLNCGYPLYKLEEKQSEPDETEEVSIEDVPELIEVPAEPIEVETIEEPSVEIEVIPLVENLPEEIAEEVPEEVEVDIPLEPVMDIESVEPVEVVELAEPVVTEEEVEVETELEPATEAIEEESVPEEDVTVSVEELIEAVDEAVTEEVFEIVEEEPEVMEVPDVEEEEVITVPDVEEDIWKEVIVEEPEPEEVAEPVPEFEPDPVIREVMENLAKNISLKIRLVNLLIEDDVKQETFSRLFESYAARGERLINSRNETLERIRYDLSTMERALEEAKNGLEELEIRKSIGDTSEEEYSAKAPAFSWDIEQYTDEVRRKKGEMEYLDNLLCLMPKEELDELNEMAETSHEALNGLAESGMIGSEMAARIKVTLEEALACLKGSV